MKRFLLILPLLIFFASCGRLPESTLCLVDGKKYDSSLINVMYGADYFNTLPTANKSERLNDLFNTLLAEKEMTESGAIKDLPYVSQLERNDHRLLLKMLYDKDVESPVLDDNKLLSLYNRSGVEKQVAHILISYKGTSRSTSERTEMQALELIRKIYSSATAENFATLAVTYSDDPTNKEHGGELGWISAGKMVPEFDDHAFSMHKGEISEPFKTPYGFHVVYLEDERPVEQQPYELVKEELKTKARQIYSQKLRQRADQYLDSIKVVYPFTFHEDAANELFSQYNSIAKTTPTEEKNLVSILEEIPFDGAIAQYGEYHVDKNWLIHYFSFYKDGLTRLNSVEEMKRFIDKNYAFDLLNKIAHTRHLDELPEFTSESRRFRLNLTLKYYTDEKIIKNIQADKDALLAFYDEKKESLYKIDEQVQVQEILVSDQNLARSLLDSIRAGADMDALATRYTERKYTQTRHGMLPLFQKGKYGAVGEKAFELDINDVAGPIAISNKFAVIRLIEKIPASYRYYEEVEGKLISDYKRLKRNEIVQEHYQILAKKYSARLNPKFLAWYETNNANH